jgi:hypothetical protein
MEALASSTSPKGCGTLVTHPSEDLVLVSTPGPVGGGRGAVFLHSLSGAFLSPSTNAALTPRGVAVPASVEEGDDRHIPFSHSIDHPVGSDEQFPEIRVFDFGDDPPALCELAERATGV